MVMLQFLVELIIIVDGFQHGTGYRKIDVEYTAKIKQNKAY